MRLLERLPGGDFHLVSFDDDNPPPYAILSHTWTDGQEVTYNDLVTGTSKHKTGYTKLCFCSERAAADNLRYFWVDTCCIEKSTSVELSTAINSMFRWYQRASRCYVYLSDVAGLDEIDAFQRSRWFTRGWTLQELLAPASVEFFSREGKRLGSKKSLEEEIYEITRIPISALRGQSLVDFSVDERMGWAAKRITTLKEDRVYCLLGIFGVFLPLIYGEGEEYATLRLREEIQRRQAGSETRDPHDLSASLPFPRNEQFTGREDQLQSLEQYFFIPDSHQHRRMTIYGLGGCGKSALALEFAYRAQARDARLLIFWVPAISQESFELAYRNIGIGLRIPGITDDNADVSKLVKQTLSSGSLGNWLMIVDNADNPSLLSAQLRNSLPHSNGGTVLFTTRSRKAAQDLTRSSVIELKDMDKAEARQLLARQLTKQALLEDDIAVDELLEILTYLPLAIVQAAAFINNNEVSVSGYISMFRHEDTEIELELFSEHFEDSSRYQEVNSTIAKTWHISFEQIRKEDQLAAEYLSFMACINRIDIPQSLLPPGGSLVQQVKALGTLTGYTFITQHQQIVEESDRERLFDMHRLVHMASVWWLDARNERAAWVGRAVARLEDLMPHGGHERIGMWTAYLPHAIHVAELDIAGLEGTVDETAKNSLFDRVGRCQVNLGQYSAAERTHRRLLLLREEGLGTEHDLTLMSMSSLALTLDYQGKYEEAELVNRQTLARYEKLHGTKHPSTVTSMGNLAILQERQGKYKEAELMNSHALAQFNKELGPEHPYTLTSMSNLAALLDRRGKYKEAEGMNRQVLMHREKVLGPEHPDTLISMNNLAGVLGRQAKYEDAEILTRQALEMYEKVLRPDHPDVLMSMTNLTLMLERQGKYKEAESLSRQTLARYEQVLGPEHPDLLSGMVNLAFILERQGKYEEAETLNRQTLTRYEEVLGPEHPDTLTSMSNLAGVLWRQGRYEEAESIHRQTLARRVKLLGPEHPATLASTSNLSGAIGFQGRYKEAESMNRETLARYEKVLGPEHLDTLVCMGNLAAVLGRQGKYGEAESINRQALVRYERVLGPEHPDLLASMTILVSVLERQGKYEEAETLNRQTLARYEKVLGPEHPDTLMSVYSLAGVLAKRNCYDESCLLLERASAAYSTVLGEDHPSTRVCHQRYSEVLAVRAQSQSTLQMPDGGGSKVSKLSRGLAKIGIGRSKSSLK